MMTNCNAPNEVNEILNFFDDSWMRDLVQPSSSKYTDMNNVIKSDNNASNSVGISLKSTNLHNQENVMNDFEICIKNEILDESIYIDDEDNNAEYFSQQIIDNPSNNIALISQSNSTIQIESVWSEANVTLDVRNLKIPGSKSNNKRTIKKYFCPYCHTLPTKFARHLENKHLNVPAVAEFMQYDKQSPERSRLISEIRKEGIFLHNTRPELNTGILMTARLRRNGDKFKKTVDDYVCCEHCKDFYSKQTIRIHYSKCNPNHQEGERVIIRKGRMKTRYVHARASEILRQNVFPFLRDSNVKKAIAYDELIIAYGNDLCDKYNHAREYETIRADMRYLGHHKVAAQTQDKTIDDYSSIFKPEHVETAVFALKFVAHWDHKLSQFKTPTVAMRLITLVKNVAEKFKSVCMEKNNSDLQNQVELFLDEWERKIAFMLHKNTIEV